MANKIRKIKLSNGQIYGIFDEGAIRLDDQGRLVTGNTVVDELVLKGLSVTEIDDVPVTEAITNVLTQNTITGEIKKRDTDLLLKDIGGASYNMDDTNGVLSLKIGKQED